MKQEKKKGFILYADQLDVYDVLTDLEIAELSKAIRCYQQDKPLPQLSRMVESHFILIKNQFKRDEEKYQGVCEIRKEIGRRGGMTTSKNNQLVAIATKSNQALPNQAEKENDTVSVTEKEKETVNVTVTVNENDYDADAIIKKALNRRNQ